MTCQRDSIETTATGYAMELNHERSCRAESPYFVSRPHRNTRHVHNHVPKSITSPHLS